ncbi:MAG: hypothetical protein Q4F61_02015 [Candidatus Saccharibacteria bacterium]|nr:hypothetical protein [Candidatus Saccharibacteria bacterium]
MGYIEECLLKSGSIYRDSNGQSFYIEEATLSNHFVVRDSSGKVVGRVEPNGINLRVQ